MLPEGNVVKQFTLPSGARVKICDDYCKDTTPEEVRQILRDIGKLAMSAIMVKKDTA